MIVLTLLAIVCLIFFGIMIGININYDPDEPTFKTRKSKELRNEIKKLKKMERKLEEVKQIQQIKHQQKVTEHRVKVLIERWDDTHI